MGQQMIDVMEGVPELDPPSIPTVLIDRSPGAELQERIGSRIKLKKFSAEFADLKGPVASSVIFRCGGAWNDRQHICELGDEVDVMLTSNISESRWPNSAVRYLKAVIMDVNRENGTMTVDWVDRADDVDGYEEDKPNPVQMNVAYNGG